VGEYLIEKELNFTTKKMEMLLSFLLIGFPSSSLFACLLLSPFNLVVFVGILCCLTPLKHSASLNKTEKVKVSPSISLSLYLPFEHIKISLRNRHQQLKKQKSFLE
jgi:hypothetical protein